MYFNKVSASGSSEPEKIFDKVYNQMTDKTHTQSDRKSSHGLQPCELKKQFQQKSNFTFLSSHIQIWKQLIQRMEILY